VNAPIPKFNARQVQSFPRTQLAADGYLALNVVAQDALDDELHQPVIEEQAVARLHGLGQLREAHRNALGVSDHVFAGKCGTCLPAATEPAPARSLPTRIFGPGRSAMMATRRPVAFAAARMRVMRSA